MERPPDSLKSFANRIARFASLGDAAQLNQMLRLSGLMDGAARELDLKTGDMVVAPRNADHLGIWERKTENGKVSFVRRMETIDEWHFYANLGRIELKGAKQRLVYLGESVARGHLYDPEFTPVMALEKTLKAQLGNELEIIDLARTNLGYQVSELAIAALQLQPDVTILFAGNNWNRFKPQPSELTEVDEALS